MRKIYYNGKEISRTELHSMLRSAGISTGYRRTIEEHLTVLSVVKKNQKAKELLSKLEWKESD